MRKIEFSRLDVNFSGKHFYENGKEVRRIYEVTNIAALLDKEMNQLPIFQNSLIDLNGISAKYQQLGIHSIKKITESGTIFYHFEFGFVFKDQERLETYDTQSNRIEDIIIDGHKYRHIRLHASIVPDKKIIILDNKCHSSPTSHYIRTLLAKHIQPTQYNSLSSAFEGLRVKIYPIPKDDFEIILQKKFKNIKEVAFSFAKPNKLKRSALPEDLDVPQNNDKLAEVVESLMEKVLGIQRDDISMDLIPIKQVKFSISIDDSIGQAADREAMRTSVKNFIQQYRENMYTDEASFKYKDSDGELVQALLNSAKLTDHCSVISTQYHESDLMWKDQRRAYFTQIKYLDQNNL